MTPALEHLATTPALRPLDPADVAVALAAASELAGWSVAATPADTPPELAVTYATGDFATALALANRIGEAAEAADHHPDLTVSYGRLAVRMHSHDVRALTSRDVRLARTVARLATEVLAAPAPPADVTDVPAQLLVSADLPEHWDRLDAFEGAGYRRVPAVVALDDDAVRPAFLYELVPDAVPPSA
ncbi:4a-hydroxytetrahydrobiopterin dehydratase [uncultured Micrococcus sp.]|uniref:4a-hydroxytetrahydrobiopterin dehydratase n=1 Tax=uncultured Micrococcus sp. TaxID=114051 RepID=UPI0025FD7C73|nr:4a-hydroxytetrahydrobiopterin dehydratase [uncultured Micrococcus sp.]